MNEHGFLSFEMGVPPILGCKGPVSMIPSQWDGNATKLEFKEEEESDYSIQVNVLRCTKG